MCQNDKAKFYIQYNCSFQKGAANNGHFVGMMAVIACFLFASAIYYLRKTAALKEVVWDMNTVTASDFTI